MGSAETQGNMWGRRAEEWLRLQESQHGPLFELMLDAVDVSEGDRFLDAGCGTGGASVLAAGRGAVVSGLDASASMIAIAEARLAIGNFQVGDLQALPFADGSFDVVYAANSVQFTTDPLAALNELLRVCAPNGQVVVSLFASPEKVDMRVAFEAISHVLDTPTDARPGPLALSRGTELTRLMTLSGLTPISSGEIECASSFPDVETLWTAIASSGPSQSAIDVVGQATVKAAVLEAVERFRNHSGEFLLRNSFQYVSARPPA